MIKSQTEKPHDHNVARKTPARCAAGRRSKISCVVAEAQAQAWTACTPGRREPDLVHASSALGIEGCSAESALQKRPLSADTDCQPRCVAPSTKLPSDERICHVAPAATWHTIQLQGLERVTALSTSRPQAGCRPVSVQCFISRLELHACFLTTALTPHERYSALDLCRSAVRTMSSGWLALDTAWRRGLLYSSVCTNGIASVA
jgi:hypothetical protein